MTRLEMFNAFRAAGVLVSGAEWSTDVLVEDAWRMWHAEGAPAGALITIERDLNSGREIVRVVEVLT